MFNMKNIKLLIILTILALPLAACGQRAALQTSDEAIIDSNSY
ncbi:MAG: putative small lipoprotein YifL [Alphaproteobacteria bacterium]|jgi:predicted small lipoprotein YifL